MDDLSLPILIYVAKDKCPACIQYQPEWEKVSNVLNGQARIVKINCYPNNENLPPPPPLSQYIQWFPSILLAGPRSYFRCFTPDDQINHDQYSDDYTIRCLQMDTSQGVDAESTLAWFNKASLMVPQIDEPTPPNRYAHLFNRR